MAVKLPRAGCILIIRMCFTYSLFNIEYRISNIEHRSSNERIFKQSPCVYFLLFRNFKELNISRNLKNVNLKLKSKDSYKGFPSNYLDYKALFSYQLPYLYNPVDIKTFYVLIKIHATHLFYRKKDLTVVVFYYD